MGRKASIRDVARRARVSPTTVSFVLNGRGQVSEETRKRVLAAVEALDYSPDLRARSLKSQRIQTLALLFLYSEESLTSSRYFRDLTASICARASRFDYRVMISLLQRSQSLADHIKMLRQDGLSSGLIVAAPSPEQVELIADNLAEFPGIVVSATSPYSNLGFVDVDNTNAMRQAIEHLMALGHQRIAYVTPQATSSHTVARQAAYTEAMAGVGLGGYERVFIVPPNGEIAESGLLDTAPTAVIAFDDVRAIQIMDFLRQRGVRVPEDIAVIGFDDEDFGLHISPRLTTLAQPFSEMGCLVADRLIQQIEDPSLEPAQCILSLQLIVRESCGAAGTARP